MSQSLSPVSQALLDSSVARLMDDPKRALAHARRAVELEPQNALCHTELAAVLGDLGDRDGAVREIRAALQLRPDEVLVLLAASEVFADVGRAFDAAPLLERAAEIEPIDRDVWLARAKFSLMHRAAADLLASAERAIELTPARWNPEASTYAGYGCALLGRWEEASAHFRIGFLREPDLGWMKRQLLRAGESLLARQVARTFLLELRVRRWLIQSILAIRRVASEPTPARRPEN